jgi:hypothetical protein
MSLTSERNAYHGFNERHETQTNTFKLTGCDHFAIPARDPEFAGKFYEQILGAVEFFRAGYEVPGKSKHIFYHIGATLVELGQQEDGVSYVDATNPGSVNFNPHWAFGTTAQGVIEFRDHLRAHGIPFAGPRRHVNVSAVSVYFRDMEGSLLEVTTWEDFPESEVPPRKPGERIIDWPSLAHNWRPR